MNDRAYPKDRDLGGGVHEVDEEPSDGALYPPCPKCPADQPYMVVPNTGQLGGLLCERCGTCFDGDPEAVTLVSRRERPAPLDPVERIAELRRQLADATPDAEHDHHGPGACPVCGGGPPEVPALRSYHPDNVIPLADRIRSRGDSEEGQS